MLHFSKEIIVPPAFNGSTGEIRSHRRLREGPFKGAIGALDGTLIHAHIPVDKQIPFRGRGGKECFQNVMAVCDFNMKFIYVMAGWEGIVHDSRVLNETLRHPSNKFPLPPEGDICCYYYFFYNYYISQILFVLFEFLYYCRYVLFV